jgi:Family of unknown function (DUF6112)
VPQAEAHLRPDEPVIEAGTEQEAELDVAPGPEWSGRLPAFGAYAAIAIKPDPTALPGGSEAEKLINGGTYFVLLACVAGALLGLGQWALGSRTSNYSQADNGKSKVVACIVAAFLTGALGAIINFFVSAGGAVK